MNNLCSILYKLYASSILTHLKTLLFYRASFLQEPEHCRINNLDNLCFIARFYRTPNTNTLIQYILPYLRSLYLQIPYAFLSSLERLVVVLIEKFPELGKGPQFLCYKAMLKLFMALARKGTLNAFLSQIGMVSSFDSSC